MACDASSLSFLRAHGLDFNAWVDGVPFLALEQEASLRKQIEDQVRHGQTRGGLVDGTNGRILVCVLRLPPPT